MAQVLKYIIYLNQLDCYLYNLTNKDNKFNQMIERINQILTEKTIAVEVRCVVNQSVIDKNFRVIIECLKDLENKQSSMQKEIAQIVQKNNHFEKELESAKTMTHIGSLSEENIKMQQLEKGSTSSKEGGQNKNLENQGDLHDLIKQLKDQMNKDSELHKKSNIQNIKDINILLKDIKQLKERVEKLEGINRDNELKQESQVNNNNNSNFESAQQNIRVLQNQLHRQSEKLDKLHSEVDKIKSKNSNIFEKLRALEVNGGISSAQTVTNQDNNNSENQIGLLKSEIQKLSNQIDNNEILQREGFMDLKKRWENTNIDVKELEDKNKNNQLSIEDIFNRLDGLNSNNNNNSTNNDSAIDKEKNRLQKQLKKLEESNRKDFNRNQEWRRRVDQSIKQHTLNISDLQAQFLNLQNILNSLQKAKTNSSMKDLGEGQKLASEKLPSISGKKNLRLKNSRDESSHKNQNDIDNKLQQFKSELQNWVRQLLQTRNIGGQDSNNYKRKEQMLDGLELRLQQIKLILERKADEEGVKKYLSFLDNKINQIWAIISQPDTEDALIARKGWNCLSCAKRLEKYRGKVGEHLNWNNMTTTNYSPPKIGQTISYNNTGQNFNNNPFPKNRQYANESESRSKQFP